MIRLYQHLFSPLFPGCCKYTPTCSNYFIDALQKKGIVRGFIIGTYRILRCNPFAKGGYDPVD